MSYSQINTLYGIFKYNQKEYELSAEQHKLANWMIDGYLSIKQDLSSLTNTEVFQLSVAAFYQDKINKALINEFSNRFSESFESVESLVKDNQFITLYFIGQNFLVSNNTEKNKALFKHFLKNKNYDDVINFFYDDNTNLLTTKTYNAKLEKDNLFVQLYKNSSLEFFTNIFEYYGFDAKTERGSNAWLVASSYARLDLLKWLESQKAPYEKYTIAEKQQSFHHTPLTHVMSQFYIYDKKHLNVYNFLMKQDKKYIQNFQTEYVTLMGDFIKHGNIKGIDFLIEHHFDFSKPNFAFYLDKCDDYEPVFGTKKEEIPIKENYIKKLKQDITHLEKEIIEASIIDSQQSESITSSKRKIKL